MTPTPEEIVKRLINQAAGAESGGPGHHWTAPKLLREAASLIESQQEEIKRLREALSDLLTRYKSLADSGDAGFWDCEEQAEVIAARAALNGDVKP
jgi:hypothetical protein